MARKEHPESRREAHRHEAEAGHRVDEMLDERRKRMRAQKHEPKEKRKRGGCVPKKARGGRTHGTPESMLTPKPMGEDAEAQDTYAGQQSNVRKEAHGEMRKHGGKVERHGPERAEGEHSKPRMDRKRRRATGGRVGADSHPLSSAAKEGVYGKDPW